MNALEVAVSCTFEVLARQSSLQVPYTAHFCIYKNPAVTPSVTKVK